MRFFPDRYPDFYIEHYEPFEKCVQYHKRKWSKKYTIQEKTGQPTYVQYWRDFEGAKKKTIGIDDYCFEKWSANRRYQRALPYYYSHGIRYILLLQAQPAGFNYATIPMSLYKVREMDGTLVGGNNKKKKKKKKK